MNIQRNGEKVRKEVNNEKSESRKTVIEETLSFITCPKCGRRYIASDGHKCPKEK